MNAYNPRLHRDRRVPAVLAMHGVQARPALPPGFAYLLMLRKDAQGHPLKPMGFANLTQLARHIHRARAPKGGPVAGLQLADSPMMVDGVDEPQPGVGVWLLDPATGDRSRYLGWAWVNGASSLTLISALEMCQPGPRH